MTVSAQSGAGATLRYLTGDTRPSLNHDDLDWTQLSTTSGSCPEAAGIDLPYPVCRPAPGPLSVSVIGDLLGNVLGVTRMEWLPRSVWQAMVAHLELPPDAHGAVVAGRPAPSGGRLYPVELYLAGGGVTEVRSGLYRYCPFQHRLVQVGSGPVPDRILQTLAEPPRQPCDLILVVSNVFWRNGFKYGEFSYQLGSLDVGVMIGQVLALADAAQLRAEVHLNFDDERLDSILGLDRQRENAYAVITLTGARTAVTRGPLADERTDIEQTDPADTASPGRPAGPTRAVLPLAAELHSAASACRSARTPLPPVGRPDGSGTATSLPPGRSLDLAAGIAARRSATEGFRPDPIEFDHLATLLRSATAAVHADVGGTLPVLENTQVHFVAQRVAGLDSGLYRYDAAAQQVVPSRLGESLLSLAPGAVHWHAAAFEAAVAFLLVGDIGRGLAYYGDRWYRIQNMEVGLVAERISLAAAAQGLGSHIHCDFVAPVLDAALGLTGPVQTTLTLVLAGLPRGSGPVTHHLSVDRPRRHEEVTR